VATRVSLANKCQILFGAAVVVIIAAALTPPWIMLARIVDRGELETARRLIAAWPDQAAEVVTSPLVEPPASEQPPRGDDLESIRLRRIPGEAVGAVASGEGFAASSARAFSRNPRETEHTESLQVGALRIHRYARAVRDPSGRIDRVLLVEQVSSQAAGRILLTKLYLVGAGLFAGALASLVFFFILKRLILSPVRELRDTADLVRHGDLSIRADIKTGDDFEELAEAFNLMLADMESSQSALRGANTSLDLKINELARSNVALFEAARVKGDFLARVSHELRTPLNSIIGFAELLEETASAEQPGETVVDPQRHAKRLRYIRNIIGAGRNLLEMINDILDMAKIEAGKMDLHIEPMSVADSCEGLLALIRPQAERKGIDIAVECPADAEPLSIETDPRKLEQIVFNFLSNAVKFTPEGGRVTLRAEKMAGDETGPSVRVSVLDTGPGIAPEHQERIFEQFTQLDDGHTRQHAGTGLGLTICKELATMLQGEIQLVSELGRGSMFSLIVPLHYDPDRPARQSVRQAARAASVGAT
jgi:signal transduction histidine kinase